MQTFSLSWRQKVGCVGLLIAIVLTVACVQLARLPGGLQYGSELTDSVVRCDFQGIHFEKTIALDEYGQIRGVYATSQWTLPHYSIIGPLLLLSGYLLIVPSRKRSPTNSQPS